MEPRGANLARLLRAKAATTRTRPWAHHLDSPRYGATFWLMWKRLSGS